MNYLPEQMKELLKKHMELRASPSEVEILLVALDLYEEDELTQMLNEMDPDIDFEEYQNKEWETPPFRELQDRINERSRQRITRPFSASFARVAMNIGIILLAALAAWFTRGNAKLLYSCGGLSGNSEIPTGIFSCRLTLGNSCDILIDSTYKGTITRQGNTEITRLPSGALLYNKTDFRITKDTTQQMFNTITTSAGDQYQVILPDGSRVRLNAASSIRFPVEFSATENEVTLKGEAFFEIAPNKKAPFYVNTGNAEIRAIGTSFNVNAYSESTIATLLSGSLEVKNHGDRVRLRPGEEAITGFIPAGGKPLIVVHSSDTAKAVTWKKIIRVYKGIPLKTFVSDIGRWYDLDMLHTECIPDRVISANLCYETPLQEVLRLFRNSGLRFMQEGRKIIFVRSWKNDL
jgi:hypothetical protein